MKELFALDVHLLLFIAKNIRKKLQNYKRELNEV